MNANSNSYFVKGVRVSSCLEQLANCDYVPLLAGNEKRCLPILQQGNSKTDSMSTHLPKSHGGLKPHIPSKLCHLHCMQC